MSSFHDEIQTQAVQMFVDGSQDRGMWQVSRGRLNFIHLPGGRFKGQVRKLIKTELRLLLIAQLKQLLQDKPNTKKPFVIDRWDQQEKKFKRDMVLVLFKDEQQMYHLDATLNDPKTGTDIQSRYSFGKISGLALGSEPLAVAEQSALRVKVLIDYLETMVPAELVLTNQRWQGPSGNARPASSQTSKPTSDGGNARPDDWNDEPF